MSEIIKDFVPGPTIRLRETKKFNDVDFNTFEVNQAVKYTSLTRKQKGQLISIAQTVHKNKGYVFKSKTIMRDFFVWRVS